MSIEYVPGNSLLHRMHPITKIIVIAGLFVLPQFFLDPLSITVILLFIMVWWVVGSLPVKRIFKYAKFNGFL